MEWLECVGMVQFLDVLEFLDEKERVKITNY